MTRYQLLLFPLLLGLLACTPKLEKRLKEQMVETPQNQAEKDKNLILQYALDNELDVQSTPSGIYYLIEKEGTGTATPTKTSLITAHYHGTLLDGSIFDSSVKRGKPFEFSLKGVIKGWQESIPLLKKGGKGKFIIPSELAYGTRGAGNKIPPNTILIFDIELIDFMEPAEKEKRQKEKDQAAIAQFLGEKGWSAQQTESGIHYIIEKEGEGEHPTKRSKVTTHYHGTLLDGTVFDSSVARGEPISFGLGQVIPGWQEAIPLLKKGGKGKIHHPQPSSLR